MDWNSSYIADVVRKTVRSHQIGNRDVLNRTFPPGLRMSAKVVAKSAAILAGLPLAVKVFASLDSAIQIDCRAADGDALHPGQEILRLESEPTVLAKGEHPSLEFLGHLSGIATRIHELVQVVKGTAAKIRWQPQAGSEMAELESYAAEMGGAVHTPGTQTILLTEANVRTAASVTAALDEAHAYAALHSRPRTLTAYEAVGMTAGAEETRVLSVQIELRDQAGVREALEAGAESVRLMGMNAGSVRECVALAKHMRADCVVEVVPDFTRENVRAYAETGADFIALERFPREGFAAKFALLVENSQET